METSIRWFGYAAMIAFAGWAVFTALSGVAAFLEAP